MYFTAYSHRSNIIEFASTFGFQVYEEIMENGESIVFKEFDYKDDDLKNLTAFDFHIKFGPHVTSFLGNSSFIVPILPQYHSLLFPELESQRTLFHEPRPCGNSIKKAYLCHSKTNKIREGDNIFFYRSRDLSGLTVIGIVENWIRASTPEVIVKFVGSRTVYNFFEIKDLCKKRVLAIRFRFVIKIERPIL
jgi:hypothetical protein